MIFAWLGGEGQCPAWRGFSVHRVAWQSQAGLGAARRGEARQGLFYLSVHFLYGLGEAWLGKAMRGPAVLGLAGQGMGILKGDT